MSVRSETGMFVRVEVDDPTASDAAAAKQLESVCPVDIFADKGGQVTIIEDNVDECILCGLCLEIGAAGSVRIVKLSGTSSAITPDGPYACRAHWEIERVLSDRSASSTTSSYAPDWIFSRASSSPFCAESRCSSNVNVSSKMLTKPMPVQMSLKSGFRRCAPTISPIGWPGGHSPDLVY